MLLDILCGLQDCCCTIIVVDKVKSEGRANAPELKTPTSTDINYFRYFEEREKGLR